MVKLICLQLLMLSATGTVLGAASSSHNHPASMHFRDRLLTYLKKFEKGVRERYPSFISGCDLFFDPQSRDYKTAYRFFDQVQNTATQLFDEPTEVKAMLYKAAVAFFVKHDYARVQEDLEKIIVTMNSYLRDRVLAFLILDELLHPLIEAGHAQGHVAMLLKFLEDQNVVYSESIGSQMSQEFFFRVARLYSYYDDEKGVPCYEKAELVLNMLKRYEVSPELKEDIGLLEAKLARLKKTYPAAGMNMTDIQPGTVPVRESHKEAAPACDASTATLGANNSEEDSALQDFLTRINVAFTNQADTLLTAVDIQRIEAEQFEKYGSMQLFGSTEQLESQKKSSLGKRIKRGFNRLRPGKAKKKKQG